MVWLPFLATRPPVGGPPPKPPDPAAGATDALLRQILNALCPAPQLREIGRSGEIVDGISAVTDLQRALADELLAFDGGLEGVVFDLERGRRGLVLLGRSADVVPGALAG